MEKKIDNDITLLRFPLNVRTRPGMYIGSQENPNVLLREIVNNSVDELLLPNPTDTIKVHIGEDGVCIVADKGRGIPRGLDAELGISKLELAMSYLHSGGKFGKGKAASIGMNGVGSAATNALSEYFEVWSNGLYIRWEKGIKVRESENEPKPEGYEDFVTITRYLPDSEMFWGTIVSQLPIDDFKFLRLVMREFLNKVPKIIINDEIFESDLELPAFKITTKSDILDIENRIYPYEITCWLDWELGRTYPKFNGTVNGSPTPEGMHIKWMHNKIKDLIHAKLGGNFDKELINLGLNCFVAVFASEVSFHAQLKEKLSDIRGFNSDIIQPQFNEQLSKIVSENKEFFDKLNKSMMIYVDSVNRSKEVREISNLLGGVTNDGPAHKDKTRSKLSATSVMDCNTTNRKDAELFIVEGKSAAGTLIKSRDRRIHSILPLRGKPLSAFNTGWEAMLRNNEWLNFVLTTGGGIDKLCNLNKVRYGKFILAADSDSDGMAITISILGTIGTHMRYLIDNKLVYLLEVPLYQDTKSGRYYYAGEENQINFNSSNIRRYKGLGEFNAIQFRDIAFNTEKRRLTLVTSEKIEEALDLIRNTQPKKDLMKEFGYLSDELITENNMNEIKYKSQYE